METLANVRYSPESEWLVINEWVFGASPQQHRTSVQNTYPNDTSFICSRSSGASDYIAEWWHINGKYQLKWIAYHEMDDATVRCDGTLITEVDTMHKVLLYCCTHLHPDL
jgi:hypothetical protein